MFSFISVQLLDNFITPLMACIRVAAYQLLQIFLRLREGISLFHRLFYPRAYIVMYGPEGLNIPEMDPD